MLTCYPEKQVGFSEHIWCIARSSHLNSSHIVGETLGNLAIHKSPLLYPTNQLGQHNSYDIWDINRNTSAEQSKSRATSDCHRDVMYCFLGSYCLRNLCISGNDGKNGAAIFRSVCLSKCHESRSRPSGIC